MKRILLVMLAMLLMAGMANAQNAKLVQDKNSHLKELVDKGTRSYYWAYSAYFEDGSTTFNPNVFDNTISSYPWAIVEGNGGHVMKSTNSGVSNSTSAISLEWDFEAGGVISFLAECRGEGTSTFWDHCDFYIDDELQFSNGANLTNDGFLPYSYELSGGWHTVTWSYTKDNSVNPSGDYFAVDNIRVEYNSQLMPITSIAVEGYDAPIAGEDSQDHLIFTPYLPANADYVIENPMWWDEDEGFEFSGTFVLGTNYSAGMTLRAKSGFYFDENCTFLINFQPSLVDPTYSSVDEDDNTIAYLWSVPAPAINNVVSEFNVEGFTGPVWGANPDMTVNAPAGTHYSVAYNCWLWVDEATGEEDLMEETDTYTDPSHTYYQYIEISLESGFVFAETNDMTVTVNGNPDLVESYGIWSKASTTVLWIKTVKFHITAPSGIIDFETGDFSQYPFVNNSYYPWIVVDAANGCDNGTQYCAMSGNKGISSSSSILEATYYYSEDGFIIFDAKCMGEGTTTFWDKCIFYIDGVVQFTHGDEIASQGWLSYLFELTAGSHTFKWEYSKDSSVNPTGDCFKVDNIFFGTGDPCMAPTAITVSCSATNAICSWNGISTSYTLRYRTIGASSWTTVTGIEDNTYTITGLLEYTDYEVEVAAECDSENWTALEFTTSGPIQSNARFYGYGAYSITGESWQSKYITFSPQDPENVTVASDQIPSTYAATYAMGYLWYITTQDHNLGRAPIDSEGNIGTPETLANAYDTNSAIDMDFNNGNELIYYLAADDDGTIYLNSFDPMNTESGATTIGTLEHTSRTLAINAEGEAYCIDINGILYSISLNDASMTQIGSTGLNVNYVQSMAFDKETGELFWAQIYSTENYGFYRVNTQTGNAEFIGQIGGGAEITGLFMVFDTEGVEEAETGINVWNRSGEIRVELANEGNYTMNVVNILGQSVLTSNISGQGSHIVKHNLANGVYVVTLSNSDNTFSTKIVVR